MKHSRGKLCAAAMFLGFVAEGQAASFDCGAASTTVERSICASPELSELDSRLGARYQQRLQQAADSTARQEIKSEQRAWLQQTRDACADELCLLDAYQRRNLALQATGQPAAAPDDAASAATPEAAPSEPEAATAAQVALPEQAPVSDVPASAATALAARQAIAPGVVAPAPEAQAASPAGAQAPWIVPASLAAFAICVVGLLWILGSASRRAKDAGGDAGVDPRMPDALPAGGTNTAWRQYKQMFWREKISFVAIPSLMVFALPVGLIYLAVYLGIGFARRCPSCKVLYGRTERHSHVVSEDSGYETVTRRDQVRVRTNDAYENLVMGGKHVANVIRQEQVHVTYTTSRVYFECCSCAHRWDELRESKS